MLKQTNVLQGSTSHRPRTTHSIQFKSNQIQQQIAPYPILEGHGKNHLFRGN